jgi:hypothetical protein
VGVNGAFNLKDFDRYVEKNKISEEDYPCVRPMDRRADRRAGSEVREGRAGRLVAAGSRWGALPTTAMPATRPESGYSRRGSRLVGVSRRDFTSIPAFSRGPDGFLPNGWAGGRAVRFQKKASVRPLAELVNRRGRERASEALVSQPIEALSLEDDGGERKGLSAGRRDLGGSKSSSRRRATNAE